MSTDLAVEESTTSQVLFLPLVLALCPSLLSRVFGSTQVWREFLLLLLLLFYLYTVLKCNKFEINGKQKSELNAVPWDLYNETLIQKGALQRTTAVAPSAQELSSFSAVCRASQERIKDLERRYLYLILSSPILGGLGLEVARRQFPTFVVISSLDICLFILTASIRPFTHLKTLAKADIESIPVSLGVAFE